MKNRLKKSLFLLTLAVVMCFASCEKYDHAIADIEDRLDKIEGTSINTIEQQITNINTSLTDLKNMDVALQTLIDGLETEAANLKTELDANAEADAATKKNLEEKIATLETLIATLQTKDTELDKKIADLKTFVNDEITATEDWAKATFATLEQYQDAQMQIEAIKIAIDNHKRETDILYAEKFADIEEAIADTETSMKEWVNSILAEGYYTKAETDGKITALQTQVAEGDATLQKEIDDLKAALKKAESGLSAAYEQAIKDAVADGGIINKTIADAVNKAQDLLQAQIDGITNRIAAIENRLTELETDFANRIQSLTYIPTHTDGKATMAYNATSGKWEAELSFFVTPKSVVGNINQEHISAKGVYTAATRAVDLKDLSVTAFDSDTDNGTITVSVSGDNLTDFLGGTSDAAVFLIISDGNSEFVSDYVSLALKNPGNIHAGNMSADDLKTTVSQALNGGVRDFTITGNLTEEQQKAVGTALRDWCGIKGANIYNGAGQGTVTLTLPDVTEVYSDTFGQIMDYRYPIRSYALGALYLPNAIKIGENGFSQQVYLREVHAPKVTTVDIGAFDSCNQLTTVEMPLLQSVGDRAFYATLISTIPGNPVTIESRAFDSCNNLTEVNLTQTTSIDEGAFRRCNNLQSVVAPLLTEVPLWAFADCWQLTSLTFAQPITQWEGQVLNNMDTGNITLTLHPNQKVLTGGSNDTTDRPWTLANGAATVEFGTNKTFCGYTFKEIKKYGE